MGVQTTVIAVRLVDGPTTFEPWAGPHGEIGYRVTENGKEDVFFYFQPSARDGEPYPPTVFVYMGTAGDSSQDAAEHHYEIHAPVKMDMKGTDDQAPTLAPPPGYIAVEHADGNVHALDLADLEGHDGPLWRLTPVCGTGVGVSSDEGGRDALKAAEITCWQCVGILA